MYRKRKWAAAGMLAVSLACTVQAETIHMGGFQIQVGGIPGNETQLPGNRSPQEKKGQNTGKFQETPTQSQERNSWEGSSIYSEKEVQEATVFPEEGAVWEVGETQTDTKGERAGEEEVQSFSVSEEILEIYQLPAEEAVAGGIDHIGEYESQEEVFQDDPGIEKSRGDTMDHSMMPEKTPEQKMEKNSEENQEESKNRKEGVSGETLGNKQKRNKRREVEFLHSSFSRLKSGQLPAVSLKGQQEICVISYSVNHQECAFRWEGNRLIPVEPPLRKGMNSLEISVFLEKGRVISMEPWYFSCGVGSAML